MRPRLLTVGTQVVTLAPRVALHLAGAAWETGQGLLSRVLRTTPPTAARLVSATPLAAPVVTPPAAEAPKGAATPTREESRPAQLEGVPTMPAPEVAVQEQAPAHADLPLEDFDHLTVGSLRSRIRSLSVEQVRQLHAYEVEHANRLPVVAVLSNRIAKLEKELAGASS